MAPSLSEAKKAERLGLSRSSLISILDNREEIMSHTNTHRIRNTDCKEMEVGKKILEWVHSAMMKSEMLSSSDIERKATEIAADMGKDFSPRRGWVQRLLLRENLNMMKINGGSRKPSPRVFC